MKTLILITIILGVVPFFGDRTVFNSNKKIFRAFGDSLVHAIIGGISAYIFLNYDLDYKNTTLLVNVVLCTCLSSVIDVDHFFVAKSLQLKDLFNLKSRGIFHCTTLCTGTAITIITISHVLESSKANLLGWMLLIAVLSHHIRDGNRRGLWCYPFGSTVPIPYVMYIALTMLLPHFCHLIYEYCKSTKTKRSRYEYV